jgi:methyl-accepting chemotaxis protein-1 (serine sensor receptor)
VKRVTGIMAEISTAANEQSSGIEQVNQAVMQMDQVTQQNAALVEEAAAAAESMREQAHQLGQEVAVFKIAQSHSQSRAPVVSPVKAQAAPPAVKVERRGPARPKNIARLPVKAAPKPTPRAAAAAKTGTDDEWSEF